MLLRPGAFADPDLAALTVAPVQAADGAARLTVTVLGAPDGVVPTITVSSPVDGASVPLGATVLADDACAHDGGAVVRCEGTVPTSTPVSCTSWGLTGPASPPGATPVPQPDGSSLLDWVTQRSYARTCHLVEVSLSDGSLLRARFQLR